MKPISTFIKASPPHKSKGSIIIGVLAIILLSTVMVFQFVEKAVQELHYRGQTIDDPDMRLTAYSALEVVLAVLHEIRTIDGKLVAPAQGWSDPLTYAEWEPPEGYEIEIWFEDESGKVPLSTLTEERLPLFLEEMGIDFSDANLLTDTLLDWMDEDDLARLNGAEKDFYNREEYPYKSINKRLSSWDELRLIEGWRDLFFDETGNPNVLFEDFTGSVSLYHTGKININAANPLVIAFLSRLEGFDALLLEEYLYGRDDQPNTEDDRILFYTDNAYYNTGGQNNSTMGSIESRMLNIKIWCRRGVSELLIDTLVNTADRQVAQGAAGIPFTVLSVTENLRIN